MKRIYLFIIKSFIGPFIITFIIAMVFLIMQFVWKYVDDIMGKDIEMLVIFKLLFLTSANVIPMALPIAILFSSIMTMGNLAESNELTAMKSAGMSLFKIMRPMVVFVILLAISTFYFSNYILPIANLKQRALIYDLQQKKTTFYIPEDTFYNDIPGMSLKVDSKDPETGKLFGVLIYMGAPRKTIKAETGEILFSDDNNFLFLKLSNGSLYEESKMQFDRNTRYAFNKTFFKESVVKFDASDFNLKKSDEDLYKRDYEMMNFKQLASTLDTIYIDMDTVKKEFQNRVKNDVLLFKSFYRPKHDSSSIEGYVHHKIIDSIFSIDQLDDLSYSQALHLAQVNIRSRKDYAKMATARKIGQMDTVNNYKVAWHQKFTLAFAVIVLFFVGAP
ncbi:MAG: LptF/LptG family permease, partial [Crocinitomicaceae bacterium]